MEKDLKIRCGKKSQQIAKTTNQTNNDPGQRKICLPKRKSLRSVFKQPTSKAREFLKITIFLLTLAGIIKPVRPVYIATSTDYSIG